ARSSSVHDPAVPQAQRSPLTTNFWPPLPVHSPSHRASSFLAAAVSARASSPSSNWPAPRPAPGAGAAPALRPGRAGRLAGVGQLPAGLLALGERPVPELPDESFDAIGRVRVGSVATRGVRREGEGDHGR